MAKALNIPNNNYRAGYVRIGIGLEVVGASVGFSVRNYGIRLGGTAGKMYLALAYGNDRWAFYKIRKIAYTAGVDYGDIEVEPINIPINPKNAGNGGYLAHIGALSQFNIQMIIKKGNLAGGKVNVTLKFGTRAGNKFITYYAYTYSSNYSGLIMKGSRTFEGTLIKVEEGSKLMYSAWGHPKLMGTRDLAQQLLSVD